MEVNVTNTNSVHFGKIGVVLGDSGKEFEVRFPGGEIALINKTELTKK